MARRGEDRGERRRAHCGRGAARGLAPRLSPRSQPTARAPRHHHHVYVIELDAAVWKASAKFRRANPARDPAKPCVYVGMTGLTPEERYANHAAGIRSSQLVHRFARRLRPDLYEGINPMSYREAAKMERVLAKVLRSDGYGVWQN